MRPKRFLIVRIAALGDIAVTTVLLDRILAEHPGSHVTWLCGEVGAPLVRMFAGVAEVVTVDEAALLRGSVLSRLRALLSTWRKLLGRRFDRVLLVHADRRYRSLLLPLVGSPVAALRHGVNPQLARFRGNEFARLLDDSTLHGPITKRYALADVRRSLSPREHDRATRTRIALVPGGARNVLRDDPLRRWPVSRYRALAERLVAAGFDVTLIGDSGDMAIPAQFAGCDVVDLIGKLSLTDALCALRDAHVVVTHDTGPLHLARLVRTPVVAIFGPTDPRHVVGDADDVVALWGGAHLACRPCYDGAHYALCSNNACMQDVSVEAVFRAVTELTTRRTPRAPYGRPNAIEIAQPT